MRLIVRWGWLLALAGLAGCGSTPTDPSQNLNVAYSQTDLREGTGRQAAAGNRVTTNYTGWLYDPNGVDHKGRQFDSGNGFAFTLGVGSVITGWDRGIAGMKVGGLRRLVIPPDLGYGSGGSGSVIPPNATLVFDVELVDVAD